MLEAMRKKYLGRSKFFAKNEIYLCSKLLIPICGSFSDIKIACYLFVLKLME